MGFLITELQKQYLQDYLSLKIKKIRFFKQHNLRKYRNMLIKLFEFPEMIDNWEIFEFNLHILDNRIKENK